MTLTLFTAFVAFAFATLITPGPNNLMLMSSGMNYGFRRTIPHLSGISSGFAFMLFLVGVGIMQLLQLIPYSLLALKVTCTLYLLYLAWKIATATGLKTDTGQHEQGGKPLTLFQAALFQWVNPKAWTMALTAISIYAPNPPKILDILFIAAVFGILVYPLNSLWILLGQQLRPLLNNEKKMLAFNVTCAVLLVTSLYPIFLELIDKLTSMGLFQ